MRESKREGECVSCGECCRVLRLTGIMSNTVAQHGSLEEARAYYSYRGFKITEINERNDTLCLEAGIVCSQLVEGKLCALHDTPEKKPLICHKYPTGPDNIETCGYIWK